MNLKTHSNTAFTYFLVAAILGLVLRSFQVFEISVTYKFFRHTHSHIALLGWVYLALTTLIYKLFVQSTANDKKYKAIFWFTQFTLVGMLLSFPFQGYALFSIIFSTLFLFASYWFYSFFLKNSTADVKKTNSYRCIKTALRYMVVSSLGPWTLGVIMNTLGAESIWYRLAIYFYLHFQYNGWMILALVGLFFVIAEEQQITVSKKIFKRFLWTLNTGLVLSFFLSTLFTNPPVIFNFLGGLGAILQLVALVFLVQIFSEIKAKLKLQFTSFQRRILGVVVALLGIKMILQLITSTPYFANLAATILDFTVGYLHLTFLGVVTIAIFLLLDYYKLIYFSQKAFYLYLLGFIATELLIFYKGIVAWQGWQLVTNYPKILWAASLLIPLSLFFMLFSSLSNKK